MRALKSIKKLYFKPMASLSYPHIQSHSELAEKNSFNDLGIKKHFTILVYSIFLHLELTKRCIVCVVPAVFLPQNCGISGRLSKAPYLLWYCTAVYYNLN